MPVERTQRSFLALFKISRTTTVGSGFPIDVHRQIKPFLWMGFLYCELFRVRSLEEHKVVMTVEELPKCELFGVQNSEKEHKVYVTVEELPKCKLFGV